MKTVFETIKDRLPITEVLSSYITLVPNGPQYKAKCPFHNERTPSFYISPERNLYYCFGCGAKGDIFTFVEQFEGLDKRGALKLLADRAGVVLDTYTTSHTDDDGIYQALEKATLIYQNFLKENKEAQEYLEKRGLTKETISDFRIGYAPNEWRTIEASCKDQKEKSLALKAGLTKSAEDPKTKQIKVYDRFRSRIMFPICDSSSRVIAFSGRIFPQSDDGPKYLNSPETEIFQKSKTLFGFDKAKIHIKKHNFAILVEGQMDLIFSHQAGFKNTVATSGTAVSTESVKDPFSNLSILSRLTSNIFLAFDGDEAGQKAMDRAALVALSLGMNPKVVVLPNGLDPADYILKNGPEAWKERLKEAKHFIDHHLDLIKAGSSSPHIFVKNIKQKLFPFLAKVLSPMERNIYINKIAKEIEMPAETIEQELKQSFSQLPKEEQVISSIKGREVTPYERLIALRQRFASPEVEKAVEELNSVSVGGLVFSAPPLEEDRLSRALIVVEEEYSSLKKEDQEKVAKELVESVLQEFLLSMKASYMKDLKQAEAEGNEEKIARITRVLNEIIKSRHERSSSA